MSDQRRNGEQRGTTPSKSGTARKAIQWNRMGALIGGVPPMTGWLGWRVWLGGRLDSPANPSRGRRVGALLSHAKGDISSRLLVAGTSP